MNIKTEINLANEKCPMPDQVVHRFTEIIICEELEIPPQKPPKEHIADTIVNPIVDDIEVIDVDLGDIIRKKVIVSGNANIGIEYSALEAEQQVHFAHFNVPFQGIIGYRPCISDPQDPDFNRGLLLPCFDIDDFDVNVCIEHVQFHQLTERKIKVVLVLLIWLEHKTKIIITNPADGGTVEVGADVDITAEVSEGVEIEEVLFEFSLNGGSFTPFSGTNPVPDGTGTYTLTWTVGGAAGDTVVIRATAIPADDACNYPDIVDQIEVEKVAP